MPSTGDDLMDPEFRLNKLPIELLFNIYESNLSSDSPLTFHHRAEYPYFQDESGNLFGGSDFTAMLKYGKENQNKAIAMFFKKNTFILRVGKFVVDGNVREVNDIDAIAAENLREIRNVTIVIQSLFGAEAPCQRVYNALSKFSKAFEGADSSKFESIKIIFRHGQYVTRAPEGSDTPIRTWQGMPLDFWFRETVFEPLVELSGVDGVENIGFRVYVDSEDASNIATTPFCLKLLRKLKSGHRHTLARIEYATAAECRRDPRKRPKYSYDPLYDWTREAYP